jgi:hypothetical protein
MSVHHVTLFDSLPHLSALMLHARPPGRCSRGSGIDCALPSRAPPLRASEHPPRPLVPQPVQPRPGGVTARAPPPARASPPPMCEAIRRRADGPPPSLPRPPPLPLPLPPSPPLSLTADSDVPAGLFANLVLRRSVRECLLHQQFQIIHHSK